jgi:hypothetical protein
MTTSRQRAQTLALDIVKKQDGVPAFARELIVLMRENNEQPTSLRNRDRDRQRGSGALICARNGDRVDALEPWRKPARHSLGSSKVIVARRKPSSSVAANRDLLLK